MLKPVLWKITIVALFFLNLGLPSQASALCVVEGKFRIDDCSVATEEDQAEASPEATDDPTNAARIVDPGLGFDADSVLSTEYYLEIAAP